MKIHLKDLTYLGEFDYLKIILSSADRFPGLYRFTSTWKNELENPEFLKVISFIEASFKSLKETWTRDEWLEVHDRIYNLGFGEKGRNSVRQDKATGEFLRQKSIEWIDNARSLSLAVIETSLPVTQIEPGQTYYMMGSLIRFENDRTYISYNHFEKNWYQELKLDFSEVNSYINSVFSPESLSELFFKAEIIGKLVFGDNNVTKLLFNPEYQNELLANFTPNSPVFGSIDYPEILPIRFAKLVGVTNVCH